MPSEDRSGASTREAGRRGDPVVRGGLNRRAPGGLPQ